MMRQFSYLLPLFAIFFLIQGCGCADGNEPQFVSTQQMHDILFSHSRKPKALIVNSRYCGHCQTKFQSTYREAIDSCGNDYRFFVVLMDSMSLDSARAYYSRMGYHGKFYVVTDGDPGNDFAFLTALMPDEPEEVFLFSGLPFSGVLNRNNRLYKERILHPIINDSIIAQVRVSKESLRFLRSNRKTR